MTMAVRSGALDFIGVAFARNARDASNSLTRLTTGRRVVQSADDPAALGVASKLSTRLVSTHRALRNANEGLAVLEVSDGAARAITDTLQRMRELAVQSASDTLTDPHRDPLQTEFSGLLQEIARTAENLEFNGRKLGNGATAALAVQVGVDSEGANRISVTLGDFTLATLGLDGATVEVGSAANARSSIDVVDSALHKVSASRSVYGALISRIEASIRATQQTSYAMTAAEGRLVDADYARETSILTRSRILMLAGQASQAQARRMSRSVVRLLQ